MQRGLVNRCVAAEALDEEIMKLAASIAAKPPERDRGRQVLVLRQLELGLAPAYQIAGQAMACNMIDAVAQEGVAAFIEKRSPHWPPAARDLSLAE